MAAQITFQRDYGLDTVAEYGDCVIQAPDGGFYVIGVDVHPDLSSHIVLLRVDPMGDTLWWQELSINDTSSTSMREIRLCSDGNLVAVGMISHGWNGTNLQNDLLAIKFDVNGNVLWANSIGNANVQGGMQVREVPGGDGYICAGGNRTTPSDVNNSAFYLVRLNVDGDTIWTRTYPNLYNPAWDQSAYCIGVMPDAGYVIAGKQRYGSLDFFHVIRTDPQGDTIWTRTLHSLGSGQPGALETLPNGHVVIAGYNFPGGGYAQPVLMELDENGDLLWYRNYQHARAGLAEWCFSMCKTSTGYALLNMDSNYNAFWLTNVDPAGDTLWTKGFTVNGGYAYSVEQTSDGGFVMTGTTQMEDTQIVLIKTDDSGNVVTSTNDIALDPSVAATLFPNPIVGTSTFQYSTAVSGSFSLVLHDGGGRVVRTILRNVRRAPGQYEEHIDLSSLASGTYTLVLSNGPRAVSVKAMKL